MTAFPYADPTLAAYLLHAAAGAYPPYFPHSAISSSLGGYPTTSPYPGSAPHLTRFSPYPLHAIRNHPSPLISPPYHRGVDPLSSSYPLLTSHIASCPARDTGKVGCEGCICISSLLYPGLIAHTIGQPPSFPSSPLPSNLSTSFSSSQFSVGAVSTTPKGSSDTSSIPFSRPSTVSPSSSSPPLRPSLFQPYKDDVL